MSQTTYLVIHILGILLAFVALGGITLHAMNGGTKKDNVARKWTAIMHGVGTFLILLGGFGMMARLGITSDFPGWVWAKLILLLIIGGIIAVPYRKPELALPLLLALPFIGALAGYLAVFKPF